MPLIDKVVIPFVAWCYGARPDDGAEIHLTSITPIDEPPPQAAARAALHSPPPVTPDLLHRLLAGLERLEATR